MHPACASLIRIVLIDEFSNIRQLRDYSIPASNYKDSLILFYRYTSAVGTTENSPTTDKAVGVCLSAIE
jgi:hypothetical protein